MPPPPAAIQEVHNSITTVPKRRYIAPCWRYTIRDVAARRNPRLTRQAAPFLLLRAPPLRNAMVTCQQVLPATTARHSHRTRCSDCQRQLYSLSELLQRPQPTRYALPCTARSGARCSPAWSGDRCWQLCRFRVLQSNPPERPPDGEVHLDLGWDLALVAYGSTSLHY